jgi:hypothetical protein
MSLISYHFIIRSFVLLFSKIKLPRKGSSEASLESLYALFPREVVECPEKLDQVDNVLVRSMMFICNHLNPINSTELQIL